jgi:hypothetical protein
MASGTVERRGSIENVMPKTELGMKPLLAILEN